MAKLYGVKYVTLVEPAQTSATAYQFGSLYLDGKKIASVLQEWGIPNCEPAAQLIMMQGYSADRFLNALRARTDENYTLESFIEDLQRLRDLESEFNRHSGSSNGGMLELTFEGCKVNMGIPLRYATAPDQEIMDAIDGRIKSEEAYYGPFRSYQIFHTLDDFEKGTAITFEELQA